MPDEPVYSELDRGRVTRRELCWMYEALLSTQFTFTIFDFVKKHGLGFYFGPGVGFFVERNPDTVLAPRGTFVSRRRFHEVDKRTDYLLGPPELTVEIVNHAFSPEEADARAWRWMNYGSTVAWVVDFEAKQVSVYENGEIKVVGEKEWLVCESLLPGFRMKLAQILDKRNWE